MCYKHHCHPHHHPCHHRYHHHTRLLSCFLYKALLCCCRSRPLALLPLPPRALLAVASLSTMDLCSEGGKTQRFCPLPPRPLPHIVPFPTGLTCPPPLHTIPLPYRLLDNGPPLADLPLPLYPFRLPEPYDGPSWISANSGGANGRRIGIRARYMPSSYRRQQREFVSRSFCHNIARHSNRQIGELPRPLPRIRCTLSHLLLLLDP